MLDKLSLVKLNRMCKSHGWEVKISTLNLVGGGHTDQEIQLLHDGQFLGKAQLQLVDPSKIDQFAVVKELVELFLQPKLYKAYLQNQEASLQSEISFNQNLRTVDFTDSDLENEFQNKIETHIFVCKEGSHYSLRKFVDDVHEFKGNWACFEQSAIAIESAEELIKMGPATWFVQNPTEKELGIISEYISRKSEINEWATIILASASAEFVHQSVDLSRFPVQPGLRKDVIRLLLGVS